MLFHASRVPQLPAIQMIWQGYGYNESVEHRPRVAILVGKNGRGSNMAALIRAMQSGMVHGVPDVVISTSAEAPALAVARDLGVATRVCPEDGLVEGLEGADWLCLAGYLRLLPTEVLEHMGHRVLNIHPALLPKYGGKGMYGLNVHRAVLASGDEESGCTVHWVNSAYDEGDGIMQLKCFVMSSDTPESLAARVLALEHQAYPAALEKVIRAAS